MRDPQKATPGGNRANAEDTKENGAIVTQQAEQINAEHKGARADAPAAMRRARRQVMSQPAECSAGTPEVRISKADRPETKQRRGFAAGQGVGRKSGKTPELLRNHSGKSFHPCRWLRPPSLELRRLMICRAKFAPCRRPNRARGR
ncbi:MAG: hypothetical protein IPG77_11615 [Betaproteobacteria bacterium]|jgi:hypothetical protein|nr:hypothetical protein [Betaproteobacteria bacterium]